MSTETAAPTVPAPSSATRRRILVLDDERSLQILLRHVLEGEGYEVLVTDDGHAALEMIAAQHVDLIILDLKMPKMEGLTFLRLLMEKRPEIPCIVLTAHGSDETAIEAMRLGAYTHLTKPFDNDDIRQTVSRALERIEISKKLPRTASPFLDLIGATPQMREVASLIKRIAPTDSTVLVTGKSGTGKELVARAIHYGSLRADKPFVATNCGAFTETLLESELFGHVKGAFTNAIADRKGLFESADRGTLFLDEVCDLTDATQVNLLRVLETGAIKRVGDNREMPVDVRFIAATNLDVEQMVEQSRIREALYYRLNVIRIELPSLQERKEDIPMLAGHFLAHFAKRMNRPMVGIDDAVIAKLLEYSWPGNVRELENTIEHAVALAKGERITLADMPAQVLHNRPAIRSYSNLPQVSPNNGQVAPASPDTQQPAIPVSTGAVPALPPQGLDLERYLMEQERALIIQALERRNGNLTEAAKLLNMTFRSIRYRVSKLNIERAGKFEL